MAEMRMRSSYLTPRCQLPANPLSNCEKAGDAIPARRMATAWFAETKSQKPEARSDKENLIKHVMHNLDLPFLRCIELRAEESVHGHIAARIACATSRR